MAKAEDPIEMQIAAVKRELSAKALADLKHCGRLLNVSSDSLVWLLTPVYSSGHLRSSAYADCPMCVVDDGLVTERINSVLNYVPWMMTEKAIAIVEKSRGVSC